ncbi:MAG TPA: ABC transporter permease [Acidimicrobiales bacterium]|nr:ABC transporter permease [Acidimicrobiales bacterium]
MNLPVTSETVTAADLPSYDLAHLHLRALPGLGRPSGARRGLSFVLPPAVVALVGLGLWQVVGTITHVRPQIFPTPWRVISQGWDWRSAIWSNTVPTLEETFMGFGLSLVCAFLLAIGMELSVTCRRALYPFLIVSQALPLIAIAPIVDLWLGFGLLPKLVVVAIVTFFPVTVGLTEGFASAELDAVKLLRSMGAKHAGVFWRLKLPGAMPYFFAGLRIAITYAVVGAIFAEYVGASSGLGIFMSEQYEQLRTDLVYAAVAVTALVSMSLFALTYLLQRATIPWYRLSRQSASS